MHLHYHRVHKTNKVLQAPDLSVCRTCESVLQVRAIAEHAAQHGDADMPYHCRKCRFRFNFFCHIILFCIFELNIFRVSSREAMFNHFLEMHCGSSLLLCPFCMYSYIVPQIDRQKNIVLVKAYVQHMMDHDLGISLTCSFYFDALTFRIAIWLFTMCYAVFNNCWR